MGIAHPSRQLPLLPRALLLAAIALARLPARGVTAETTDETKVSATHSLSFDTVDQHKIVPQLLPTRGKHMCIEYAINMDYEPSQEGANTWLSPTYQLVAEATVNARPSNNSTVVIQYMALIKSDQRMDGCPHDLENRMIQECNLTYLNFKSLTKTSLETRTCYGFPRQFLTASSPPHIRRMDTGHCALQGPTTAYLYVLTTARKEPQPPQSFSIDFHTRRISGDKSGRCRGDPSWLFLYLSLFAVCCVAPVAACGFLGCTGCVFRRYLLPPAYDVVPTSDTGFLQTVDRPSRDIPDDVVEGIMVQTNERHNHSIADEGITVSPLYAAGAYTPRTSIASTIASTIDFGRRVSRKLSRGPSPSSGLGISDDDDDETVHDRRGHQPRGSKNMMTFSLDSLRDVCV